MPVGRHFLGWSKPPLPAAVDWLGPEAERAGWDLSKLLIVVPAARAARRLTELLVDAAGGALPGPPTVVTMGNLPEALFEAPQRLAEDWHALLARAGALREAPADELEPLLPRPPARDDWAGWWSLAEQFHSLNAELAAHRLTPAEVPKRCEDRDIELPHPERWHALATLEQRYQKQLAEVGLLDPQAARLAALRDQRCRCEQHLILLATADLNPLIAGMIEQLDTPLTALVHAPEEHAAGFDAFGALEVDYWQNQRVPIEDDQLRFVDRPADQARAAAEAIDRAHRTRSASDGRGFAVDEVSVGLGDETLAGPMQRTFELAGLTTRYGPGGFLSATRPAMLLEALGRFAAGQRFDDLAALLRHPDIESYLLKAESSANRADDPEVAVSNDTEGRDGATSSADEADAKDEARLASTPNGESSVAEQSKASDMAKAREHWLVLLDRYANEHLQGRVDGAWLGDKADQARLKRLWQAIQALLPDAAASPRPLPEWSVAIANALKTVYGDWSLDRRQSQDDQLCRALEALADELTQQHNLPADAPFTPRVDFAQAVTLTLRQTANATLPEPGGKPAVEVMGQLDLAMDDAPLTVVTSLNEGCIPAALNSDPFLPNELRSKLGLADNARRYARDLFRLRGMLASRASVTLLAARQTTEGDPIPPSRLLLACGDATLQHRITRFYEAPGDDQPRTLLTPGKRDRFLIPMPETEQPVIARLRVTAFADYLACPYRFYLKHVRRLNEMDDQAEEMDPLTFGSLLHEVLNRFGQSEWIASTDVDALYQWLSDTLDRLAAFQFGKDNSRVAVRLQVEQMRRRLYDFAYAQAACAQAGWRLVQTERDLEATLDVDGEPFTITGRVDRIDYHETRGYRILDYKTSDRARTPSQTHRGRDDTGQRVWRDLQLPLYQDLGEALGLEGSIELGYFNLPKQPRDAGIAVAEWDEAMLAEAKQTRDEIIRAIRRQQFWPPAEPPTWADPYTRICADHAIQRDALVQASAQADTD